ncbi:hypothetical protein [Streptomyces flavofungini]|uniref:hypothetical protein n=1 Tax=Streptomyces flavofungini TaxID=68200 RepID=UPI0034DFDCA6
MLDKLKSKERASRVVEHRCTKAGESATGLRAKMPRARALLLKHWDLEHYGGDHDEFYGRDGGCDASGYGIPDLGDFAYKASSFRSYGTCTSVTGYEGARYGGESTTWDNRATPKPIGGIPALANRDNNIESWWLKAS